MPATPAKTEELQKTIPVEGIAEMPEEVDAFLPEPATTGAASIAVEASVTVPDIGEHCLKARISPMTTHTASLTAPTSPQVRAASPDSEGLAGSVGPVPARIPVRGRLYSAPNAHGDEVFVAAFGSSKRRQINRNTSTAAITPGPGAYVRTVPTQDQGQQAAPTMLVQGKQSQPSIHLPRSTNEKSKPTAGTCALLSSDAGRNMPRSPGGGPVAHRAPAHTPHYRRKDTQTVPQCCKDGPPWR